MSPLEKFLSRLRDVKETSNGSGQYAALCPVHENDGGKHKASLSVGLRNGRVVAKCHAPHHRCTFSAIARAVNMGEEEFFYEDRPQRRGRHRSLSSQRSPTGQHLHQETPPLPPVKNMQQNPDYATADAAIMSYGKGSPSSRDVYFNAAREVVGVMCRWDHPDAGKDIRPVSLHDGRWYMRAMASPRPLFMLFKVEDAVRRGEWIFVVEGEKAAKALIAIGLNVTTSSHGANHVDHTDWTPLRGANVILWPDNDSSGKIYVQDVAKKLRKLGANVRIVEFREFPLKGDAYEFVMPEKGDAFDFIEYERRQGSTDAEIKETICRHCKHYLATHPDTPESADISATAELSSAEGKSPVTPPPPAAPKPVEPKSPATPPTAADLSPAEGKSPVTACDGYVLGKFKPGQTKTLRELLRGYPNGTKADDVRRDLQPWIEAGRIIARETVASNRKTVIVYSLS